MSGKQEHRETVLVTGANRGLGLEFARQWLAEGACVFAGCRRPDRADALAQLAGDPDHELHVLSLDVTDQASVDAAVAEVRETAPCLDVLVNNAGVSPHGEEFSNVQADAMLGVMHVNAVAPLIVAQRCHALLRQSPHPRIVNISSSMGSLAKKDYGRHYSYSASKAALNMLTRAAAADLRNDGIVVVALHPGWVQTDLGGSQATLSPRESVAGLLQVIAALTPEKSGHFLTWNGDEQPW